jgi:hypothetical protein
MTANRMTVVFMRKQFGRAADKRLQPDYSEAHDSKWHVAASVGSLSLSLSLRPQLQVEFSLSDLITNFVREYAKLLLYAV